MQQIHVIVKGKVQGVGFRAKTKYLAEELKLTGYVRNLSDGTVEICAQGSKERLDLLLQQLKNAFSPHIEDMVIIIKSSFTPFNEFRITVI